MTRTVIMRGFLLFVLLVANVLTASAQTEDSGITVEGASLNDETTLVIPAVTIAVDGWLVVHDSDANGDIVAPAIISEPVALSAGEHEDIEVTLTTPKAGGDKIFPMLHIDAGVTGTYEFPGADTPVKNGEDAVVVPLVLAAEAEVEEESAPETTDSSITAGQAIDLVDGKIILPSATIAQDGWIVIHDSDAEGSIVAPAIISEPVPLKTGTTTDIVIPLTSDITDDGHKVYAMLHIDAGVTGTYEFPGADAPVKRGDRTVVVPFTLTVAAPAPVQMPTTGLTDGLILGLFVASALVILWGVILAQRHSA